MKNQSAKSLASLHFVMQQEWESAAASNRVIYNPYIDRQTITKDALYDDSLSKEISFNHRYTPYSEGEEQKQLQTES